MAVELMKEAAERSAQSLVGGLRILLVEDHDDSRLIFQMVLQRKGHSVEAAATAGEALRLAGNHRFDLVISDIGLPDLSGAELMTILRDRYSMRGMAITGFGMDEDVQRSKSAGFDYHLTKPVDPAKIDQLLAGIMAGMTRDATAGDSAHDVG
jgi:CheY-like chemotaxis protein